MTCEEMREQVSAWVDGEVPHELRAAVNDHDRLVRVVDERGGRNGDAAHCWTLDVG